MKLTAVKLLGGGIVIAVLACSIFLNTIYTVNTGQEVVIQRFGKYITTVTKSGINYKLPFIDKKTVVDVSTIRRMEFGFATTGQDGSTYQYDTPDGVDNPDAKMLTGDENIALVETIIQYQIKDSANFLFQVNDSLGTLHTISESTIRRIIASHTLDEALTENKFTIQSEIMTDLQALCDKYSSGIKIMGVQLQDVNPPTAVDAAFRDVAGAREDKTSYINEANAYRNEVLPTARGEAATLINTAEAYATNRVEEAKAAVTAYAQLYTQYINGVEVTRSRMYLETLQQVLRGVELYIMDDQNGVKLFEMGGVK